MVASDGFTDFRQAVRCMHGKELRNHPGKNTGMMQAQPFAINWHDSHAAC